MISGLPAARVDKAMHRPKTHPGAGGHQQAAYIRGVHAECLPGIQRMAAYGTLAMETISSIIPTC